eukprot:snap_masked-scaffold_1-processed-gene-2.38-mRNA-1 protein AED:0.03 eAED:0.05 QI:0/-1/0/1/-1/1/1/0/685
MSESIKVVVRCRPKNKKEVAENRDSIVKMNRDMGQVTIENKGESALGKYKTFSFDQVYDETAEQKQIYDDIAFPLVENVIDGFNGTIFSYGQTGAGKTWSMIGENTPELQGIIPNSFEHIFKGIRLRLHEAGGNSIEFLVRASFLEIYNEEIRDLLYEGSRKENSNLKLKEVAGLVEVMGLTYHTCENELDLREVLAIGNKKRSVGETKMNAQSSRSHSIFTIVIEKNEKDTDGKDHLVMGKLNLVDLAGSERQTKTAATGTRLKEGCKINLSLSALGNVISALVEKAKKPNASNIFIPYRVSKLTRLLQDSLGGNTKTVMISNISPADYNFDETMSTLRYADRAKSIQNKPVINEDPTDALLREYQQQIKDLKRQLDMKMEGPPLTKPQTNEDDENHTNLEDELKEKDKQIKEEKEKKEKLQLQLKRMESRLIHQDMAAEANSKAQELLEFKEKKEKKNAELSAQRKIRAQEEQNLITQNQEAEDHELSKDLTSTLQAVGQSSFEQDFNTKTKHILKMMKKKLRKQEEGFSNQIVELKTDFEQERSDLLQTIMEQNREFKRLEQIIECILPVYETERIYLLSEWDECDGMWYLPDIENVLCPRCNTRKDQVAPLPQLRIETDMSTELQNSQSAPCLSPRKNDYISVKQLKAELQEEPAANELISSSDLHKHKIVRKKPRHLEPL